MENDFRNLLLRKAARNITVEIPEAMVNERLNNAMEDISRRMSMQGMTRQQYFQMMGVDEQSYRGFMRPGAENELRTELLLEKVAEAEGLTVTDEEIEEEYKKYAERYDSNLEDLKNRVPREAVESDLKMRKASDLILASGVATDEPEKDETGEPEADAAPEAEAPAESAETAE